MRPFVIGILFVLSGKISPAQLSVAAAYGSFHVRGESNRVKGSGPSLAIEYVGYENKDQQVYLDVSLYNKSFDAGTTGIYDDNDVIIGEAQTTEAYSIKHIELGFKRALAGDFTETKSNFFLCGGGALSFVNVKFKYVYNGLPVPDDRINNTIYGFHFGAGGQFRLTALMVVELRGNFDFLVKPIEVSGGDNHSYFFTSTKLGIAYQLTKRIKRGI